MSLLFDVVYAQECTSSHHKLAMDALRQLEISDADAWCNLLIKYFDRYLDGSKAPDKRFRDFRNHVLHVRDNYWGGAPKQARVWYERTVVALREKRWSEASYAAGVLSHYYTDPIMPFHTAQSEEETVIHRAVEWSVTKSYDELRQILIEDLGGYPEVPVPEGGDWVEQMVRQGAEHANPYYELIIDHYNFERGVKDPLAGMDQECKDCFARMIGFATVGFARILERAFAEANVQPPGGRPTLMGYLAALTVPIAWVTRKLASAADRRLVRRMFREFKKTGRVLKTLPADDRVVRAAHAEEVLQVSLEDLDKQELGPLGGKFGEGTPERQRKDNRRGRSKESRPAHKQEAADRRFYLELDDDVVDAPSIGPKTARRLSKVGIESVEDLLASDPDDTAERLRTRHIDSDVVRAWQAQAELVCCIPHIRGHDAQLLVACDFTQVDNVAAQRAEELHPVIVEFALSKEGQRLLRRGDPPDAEEVANWINWAGQARRLEAA